MGKKSIYIGLILIGIIIGAIFTDIIFIFFIEEKLSRDIAFLILELIPVPILLLTGYFIYLQVLSSKKLADITSRPKVSVGIASFNGLDNTRIIINNFSNFPAFVWTKLNLTIDDKDENEHLENTYYCRELNVWEIDPLDTIHPFIVKPSILEHREEKITIDISVFYSSDSKLPKNPEWIKLNSYGFTSEEGQWLKEVLGIPYFFVRAIKTRIKPPK